MQINIFPPVALCERGRRSKNEDNIYPTMGQATIATNTFLVCDGVGGAEKGEVASQIVTEAFGTAFEQQMANSILLHQVLDQVQAQVDDYIRQHKVKGMGTTLTFLQLNENGATIAHAGDSRVYHIRGNKVLFCTSDHSLVNDLKKKGLHEEAAMAGDNIITRAIQGASTKEISLEIAHISDIQAGDYFLLCSDGVWGVIPDEKLVSILKNGGSDEEKLDSIQQRCIQSSKDNYSAYLIKIQSVSSPPVSDENVHPGASPLSTFTEFEQPRILVENTRKSSSFNWLKTVGLLGLLGFIGLGTWYFIGQQNEINVEEKHIFPTIESIENKETAPIEKNTSLEEPFLEKKKNTKKKSRKKTKKSVIPKPKKKEIIPVSTLSTEIAPVIPLEVINKQSPQTKIDREVIPFPSVLIDSFKLDSLEKN